MPGAAGEYKVVLLGEGRVGKTSILSRFANDRFSEDERSTTQASMFTVKSVPLPSGIGGGSSPAAASPALPVRSVRLAVWDTAGQERFHALAPIYYRSAAGAMLVYDVCDRESLRKVRVWVRELRTVAGDGIRLVVCGNKCDRPVEEQDVSPAEAEAAAAEVGAAHFFTSAKTGLNVHEAFRAMAGAVFESDQASSSTDRAGGVDRGRRWRGAGASAAGSGPRDDEEPFQYDGEPSNGLRTTSDYDASLRPPRARRPLTLADASADGDAASGATAGGGGCC